ncbi:MAG: hypothetical protein Phog2KO_39320 [Phototrophicaceae bacterium]
MTTKYELKSREIDILQLMNEELTNREIAERLHISKETVRWYAKQIYNKLDVSSRQEASEKALKIGAIGHEEARVIGIHDGRSKYILSMQLTSFVGRQKQIDEIMQYLHNTRLLTLTGPGGTGKTRLSIRVAELLVSDFDDGVYFIDLAPVVMAEMVAHTLANKLNIFESSGQPILDAIKRAIGQRDILLIMDNYEHVIDAAALLVELLMAAPNLKVIVTSREPLRISGEQVYSVTPMSLSGNSVDGLSEAMSLFLERSQAVKSDFDITDANADTIIEICQRLDGIPLAIELAAALSRFLTPDAILSHMGKRFQTLTAGLRDAPARQQTLRNAIDWSYNLLTKEEKILFSRLSVFRGGRSLEAIEAVCSNDLILDVLSTLSSLVDKCVVRQIEDELGEPRFVMLETLQEYAMERLAEDDATADLRIKHTKYYVDLTLYACSFLRMSGYDYWFRRLNIEYENLHAALQWSLDGNAIEMGLRLVNTLQDFWFYEGHHMEGQYWTEQALQHVANVDFELQIGVLMAAGKLAHTQATTTLQASSYYEQAFAIARQHNNLEYTAWALIYLAASRYDSSAHTLSEYDKAIATCNEGKSIFITLNHKVGLAQAYNFIGNIHRVQKNLQLAEAAYERCLEICLETGEQRREMMTYANFSEINLILGKEKISRKYAIKALNMAQLIDFHYMTVLLLGSTIPAIIAIVGRYKQAANILGASAALQQTMNITQLPDDQHFAESVKSNLKQRLGDKDFQLHLDIGSKRTLEETVAFALAELEK